MTFHKFHKTTHPSDYASFEVFYASSAPSDDEGGPGWYWWPCYPGCMPDGDAIGPFESERLALADAQDGSVEL